jgi:hypothetical protein
MLRKIPQAVLFRRIRQRAGQGVHVQAETAFRPIPGQNRPILFASAEAFQESTADGDPESALQETFQGDAVIVEDMTVAIDSHIRSLCRSPHGPLGNVQRRRMFTGPKGSGHPSFQ